MPDAPDPSLPDPEIDEAIRLASAHLGVEHQGPEANADTSPAIDFSGLPWRTLLVSVITLVVLLGGSALLDRRPKTPDPSRLEADLRWSVAQVVTEVERLRGRLGRLPDPSELHGILSEAVAYQPRGDAYLVVGERAGVRVEFDGRLPLETWRTLELYGAER